MEYEVSKVKVEKLFKREGNFEAEGGRNIPYSNYYIEFTINGYPLVFRAKLDKVLKDYVDEAYNA